jgi:hypothetical protein
MANEQKQKIYICHDYSWVAKQFFAHENKKIWIATVNYEKIAKNFKSFWNFTNSNRQKRQQEQI